MTATELEQRIQAYMNVGARIEWVDPRSVTGISPAETKQLNWERHHGGLEEETDDSIVADYLYACAHYCDEPPSAYQFVQAAVFLMTEYWSTYASSILPSCSSILEAGEVDACVDLVRRSFQGRQEWPVRALLRDFTVDFFRPADLESRNLWTHLSAPNQQFVQWALQDREHVFSLPPDGLTPAFSPESGT